MKGLLLALFGRGSRFSAFESNVLNCVRNHLDSESQRLWDSQVHAINKVQRLPGGVEVNFYRMRRGRVSFDERISFKNWKEELLLATVTATLPNAGAILEVKVWCVNGFLFSLEYDGNADYFEEAAEMDPKLEMHLDCTLNANLEASER